GADRHTVTVDRNTRRSLTPNPCTTLFRSSAGSHSVQLSGVASNCSVSGGTSRSVDVPAGGTASTSFSVGCAALSGNLTVSTNTSGSNLDPDGYTVTVDGGASQTIGTNGRVAFTHLSTGSTSVARMRVAANCTVSGG